MDNYKTFGEKIFVSWWKIWQRKLLQNCLFVLPNNATPQISTFANSHAKVFCYTVIVLVYFDHWLSAGVEDYGLINTLGFVACLVIVFTTKTRYTDVLPWSNLLYTLAATRIL